ncbi:unnamed protein product [Effrenium voratum]|nr:unnamed protein product [Effrenium voratum]
MPTLEDCDCALCHQLIYEPVVLPCAHVFCRGCLAQCLEHGAGRRCPLCRRLHAAYLEDLAPCQLLASLLEERFPAAYKERRAAAFALPKAVPRNEAELGLFVLEPLLPLQRLQLNVFEPRYCALMRLALSSGRRFGMVGFNSGMSHLQHGCEVVMEDCMQFPNGHFQVQIVGTRAFKILEVPALQADGYLLARIAYLDESRGADADADAGMDVRAEDVSAAEEMLPELEEWQGLVKDRRLSSILQELGPRPPCSQPGKLALWAAALINPLPPLGLAPELRAEVLAAEDPQERLQRVRAGLQSSLAHLQALQKSPVRRFMLWLCQVPAPVTMTTVWIVACLISMACGK